MRGGDYHRSMIKNLLAGVAVTALIALEAGADESPASVRGGKEKTGKGSWVGLEACLFAPELVAGINSDLLDSQTDVRTMVL